MVSTSDVPRDEKAKKPQPSAGAKSGAESVGLLDGLLGVAGNMKLIASDSYHLVMTNSSP